MELPLPFSQVYFHNTGDSLKCGSYFYLILYKTFYQISQYSILPWRLQVCLTYKQK